VPLVYMPLQGGEAAHGGLGCTLVLPEAGLL
jgi:hypothetical protein